MNNNDCIMTDNEWNAFEELLKKAGFSKSLEQFKQEVLPKVSDFVKSLIEAGSLSVSKVTKKVEEAFDQATENAQEIKQAVKENGGIVKVAQLLWNFEEDSVDELKLEDVIKWVKSHYDKNRHIGGCLYEFKTSVLGAKEYHVCFLNKNNEPLLDGSDVHLVVHAKKIDEALKEQFGNKNMVVFR